jgi:hypothetical protein
VDFELKRPEHVGTELVFRQAIAKVPIAANIAIGVGNTKMSPQLHF